MSPRVTGAVALRVLRQLRHDHRTIALMIVMPVLLLWLVEAIFTESPGVFERVGALMLGLFPFILIFLVTSITTLRERTQGTLERLMASPLGRGDLMLGYAAAFLTVAALQTVVTVGVGVGLLDIPQRGSLWLAVLIVLLFALLGVTSGLFLSAFARNEFQAVQFFPAAVLPQFLLSGLLVPVERLPDGLHVVARVLPLTYAFDALDGTMRHGKGLGDSDLLLDVLVLALASVVLLAAGSLTLRRQTMRGS